MSTGLSVVTTMFVQSGELVLGGHVEDVSGNDAQSGSVTFEYCSYKGGPPNDSTRADEAPLEACANGSASWARLASISVNPSGNAYMNFGVVRIPRTVGFRIKFSGRTSGIPEWNQPAAQLHLDSGSVASARSSTGWGRSKPVAYGLWPVA